MSVLNQAAFPTAVPKSQLVVLPDGTQPIMLGSGRIRGILGEGGASIVYEVWNEQLAVPRAVKLLRPNAMADWFERFTMEMRITAHLKHPNIIEIHSVGEWNGLPFIEMEKLEGQSLDKIIRAQGALPTEVCLAIGIMVCRALRYTHNHDYEMNGERYRGILHRDLKPANIMLSRSGIAKLMDFGLATPTNVSIHTMQGTVVGSMQYLAPEQLQGAKATPQTDMFAFGCILYEMISGKQSFPETNMAKLVSERLKNHYVPLKDLQMSVLPRLRRLVEKCMALDPARRISTAAEALHELEAMFRQLTDLQPEEVVEYYLRSSSEKKVVRFRRKIPVAPLALSGAAVVIVAVGTFAIATLTNRPAQSAAQFAPPATPGPADRHDPAASEPQQPVVPAPAVAVSRKAKPARGPTARRRTASQDIEDKLIAPSNGNPPEGDILPRPSARRPSAVEKLAAEYGSSDLVNILAQETVKRRYASALAIYDALSPADAQQPKALLYKLRALQGLADRQKLNIFVASTAIDDGEYYLARTEMLYRDGNYAEALRVADKARSAQALLGDRQALEREALYFRALCRTALLGSSPSADGRQSAIEGWFDVKFAYRSNQTHPHYAEANEQIRRLSNQPEGTGR